MGRKVSFGGTRGQRDPRKDTVVHPSQNQRRGWGRTRDTRCHGWGVRLPDWAGSGDHSKAIQAIWPGSEKGSSLMLKKFHTRCGSSPPSPDTKARQL